MTIYHYRLLEVILSSYVLWQHIHIDGQSLNVDEKNSFTANSFLTRSLQGVILDIAFSFISKYFEILPLCNWNVSYLSKITIKKFFKSRAAIFLFISHIIIVFELKIICHLPALGLFWLGLNHSKSLSKAHCNVVITSTKKRVSSVQGENSTLFILKKILY